MVKCTNFKMVNSRVFFNSIPQMSFINKYVGVFGLKSIDDTSLFTKYRYDTSLMENMLMELIPEIILFVRPFALRSFKFEKEIKYKKCVTFLRYLLNYHNYILLKYEFMKYSNVTISDTTQNLNVNSKIKKIIYYRIIKAGMDVEEDGSVSKGNGYISDMNRGITIKHNVLCYFD